MQVFSNRYQGGFAHIILIVVAVALLGAVGYVGFRALTKDKSLGDIIAGDAASIVASEECMKEFSDKDLCKFLSSWNTNQKYKLEITSTTDGQASKSTMSVDGDKSYMKVDGEFAMEVITIGDSYYTKAGDTWWKQSVQRTDSPESAPSKDDFKFEEPTEDSEEKNTTKYVKIGEEACGDLNCFKYQVVDPSDSETTEYIWFDDKDYLIRKMLTEDSDGYKSESMFSYDNISIEIPSPVKELAPNQYIMPGQTEPQTMPDGPSQAELDALMQQYAP